MLAFGGTVADFTAAVEADCPLQRMMSFAFVEPDLGTPLEFGIQNPVDHEQGALDATDFPQGCRELVLPRIGGEAPNQKWAGDITYVWTREGWVYLAVILDLYSRRVIGWATGDRLKQDLALRALNMALALRKPPPGCIQHTDRGSQYCAHEYQKLLLKHQLLPSMSGKGNCFDNSAVESFFKSLKAELIWRRHWQTRRDIEIAIFEYINGFYNPRRRHSTLGWKSPVAFEKKAA